MGSARGAFVRCFSMTVVPTLWQPNDDNGLRTTVNLQRSAGQPLPLFAGQFCQLPVSSLSIPSSRLHCEVIRDVKREEESRNLPVKVDSVGPCRQRGQQDIVAIVDCRARRPW